MGQTRSTRTLPPSSRVERIHDARVYRVLYEQTVARTPQLSRLSSLERTTLSCADRDGALEDEEGCARGCAHQRGGGDVGGRRGHTGPIVYLLFTRNYRTRFRAQLKKALTEGEIRVLFSNWSWTG